jgi:hypothetical protein
LSKTAVPIWQTTWCHIRGHCNLDTHGHVNLKFHISFQQFRKKFRSVQKNILFQLDIVRERLPTHSRLFKSFRKI